MDGKELLKEIKSLSNSQGFYSRMYRDLMELEIPEDVLDEFIIEYDINDIVSFIMEVEG